MRFGLNITWLCCIRKIWVHWNNLPRPGLKEFFYKILAIWANFGDFGVYGLQILDFGVCVWIRPCWNRFWENLKNGIDAPPIESYDNPPREILILVNFLSNFLILGLRISNFGLSPNLSISLIFSSNLIILSTKMSNILPKFKFCVLGLRISNFDFR